jgi:acyl carrier protein
MGFPTYEEFIESLASIAGAYPIRPDEGLFDQPIDSIDIVEWLYKLQDQYQITFDESALEIVGSASIRDIHDFFLSQTIQDDTRVPGTQ